MADLAAAGQSRGAWALRLDRPADKGEHVPVRFVRAGPTTAC